mmetsp:Transcript_44925/g.106656  ORF Transcript_44925/g.106656 Transcript_44925/m.106656 type:complete len:118 (-) Transcript_44925:7-360(-)
MWVRRWWGALDPLHQQAEQEQVEVPEQTVERPAAVPVPAEVPVPVPVDHFILKVEVLQALWCCPRALALRLLQLQLHAALMLSALVGPTRNIARGVMVAAHTHCNAGWQSVLQGMPV